MSEYFVRDTRQVVGNMVLWWGKDRKGYTCNIDEAGRYPEKEARSIERSRGTDKAYPCDEVERIIKRGVDIQDLQRLPSHLAEKAQKDGG